MIKDKLDETKESDFHITLPNKLINKMKEYAESHKEKGGNEYTRKFLIIEALIEYFRYHE